MSMETPIILSPCPFCGIKRKIKVIEDDMFYVQCLKCGTRTDYYLWESDAIAAWNQRAPSEENRKLVEALEEIEAILETIDITECIQDPCEVENKVGNAEVIAMDAQKTINYKGEQD
jgi:Lar family restriction alleviation protein